MIPVDSDTERQLQTDVRNLLKLSSAKFPGAQPVSFLASSMELLKNKDFFVGEKSDGIRYLLYFTRDKETSQPVSYLIDRKNKYKLVKIKVPNKDDKRKFITNTIIDGELVESKKDGMSFSIFLAFDILVFNEKILMNRPFTKRLGYLKEFVMKPYVNYMKDHPDKLFDDDFQLQIKELQLSYRMNDTVDHIKSLAHENDGLIFTSAEDEYVCGTCTTMMKWKPPELNSVDFKISLSPDSRIILNILTGNNVHKPFAELTLSEDQKSAEFYPGRIVECGFDKKTSKWGFLRFREDKESANYITVVNNIMQSINEGVSLEQITDSGFLKECRDNWKEEGRVKRRKQYECK